MKKLKLIIIFIVFTNFTFGQINGVVADLTTKRPIPYVNIWIKNTGLGTSSNELGYFNIDTEKIKSNVIVFSSIGYSNKNVVSTSLSDTVFLKTQISEIPEIVISANKEGKEKIIGKLKHQFPSSGFGCGKSPWIIARFFPYKSEYIQTPFLKTVKFLTHSKINNAKFIVRFYTVNEKNEPKIYLTKEKIIGIAKRGSRKTEIDLSPYEIIFPKEGLFIAIEWLIIKENKYTYDYTIKGSKKKYKNGVEYEPSFSTFEEKNNENSWQYYGGNWKPTYKNGKGTYNILQTEIKLTN